MIKLSFDRKRDYSEERSIKSCLVYMRKIRFGCCSVC